MKLSIALRTYNSLLLERLENWYDDMNPSIGVSPLAGKVRTEDSKQLSTLLCDVCKKWTLDLLRKLPSVSIKENHRGMGQKERIMALLANRPIFLDIGHIRKASSRCSVCNLIYMQLKVELATSEDLLQVYSCEDLEGGLESLFLYSTNSRFSVATITLFADENSFASKYILYRPVGDPGSDKTIRRIKDWIHTCNENHPNCQYSISGTKIISKLPSRVLDIGSSGEVVHLLVTDNISADYIALSHCWGGVSQILTTKTSLEDRKTSITLNELSKNVQEAIYVVRRIGIRYLWVDSLCIIQDDEEDWLREASRMASVYEGAYCTIAAAAAEDGGGGCFVPRQPNNLVRLQCRKDDVQSGHMYLGVKDESAVQLMFQGPLHARGWVLQEHIFSHRIIHFALDQTYWECDKVFVGEDRSDARGTVDVNIPTRSLLYCILEDFLGLEGMPRLVSQRPVDQRFTKADFYTMWAQIVKYYSRCGLTKASDKLQALLSLSTELQRLTGDGYHEGHWLKPVNWDPFFVSSLLWGAAEDSYLRKPPFHCAPSWSWAALDGPLDFADFIETHLAHIFHPTDTDLEVLQVKSGSRPALHLAKLCCSLELCFLPPDVKYALDLKPNRLGHVTDAKTRNARSHSVFTTNTAGRSQAILCTTCSTFGLHTSGCSPCFVVG